MNDILRVSLAGFANIAVELKGSNVKKLRRKKKPKAKQKLRQSRQVVQCQVDYIDGLDTDSCISIWQSVVVQGFYDLLSACEDYEQKMDKAKAVAWFGQGVSRDNNPTDFELVCELAGLDPFAIMKLARRVIRGENKQMGENLISGFNFRTVRKFSSNRIPRKKP
jgi:hypothetical protein